MNKVKQLISFLFVFCGVCFADTNSIISNLSINHPTLSLSLGLLNGEAKEQVFYSSDSNTKLSELEWKSLNIPIIKINYRWEANQQITFNVKGWASIVSGSGYMDDYDWLDTTYPTWTDHSWHPNTTVEYANEYDVNLRWKAIKNDVSEFSILAGYQGTRFSWLARGGYVNYEKGTIIGSVRDQNSLSIGYKLNLFVPYIGVSGSYRFNDLDLNLLLKFSNVVSMTDHDEHYQREIYFDEKTEGSNYYGLTFDIGYYATDKIKLFTELAYSIYKEARGDSTYNEYKRDVTRTISTKGIAGILNMNYDISCGIQYQF